MENNPSARQPAPPAAPVVRVILYIRAPFGDAFRAFCYEPGEQDRSTLLAIPTLSPLFSDNLAWPEATNGR